MATTPLASEPARPALRRSGILRWAYAESGTRDLRFDFLRGYALVAMFINHIRGNSWMYIFSGHERFYTSAAEVFYFISGLVLGIVAARQPLGRAVRRVLHRTWVLYCVAVGIALSFTALGLWTDLRLWYDAQNDLPRGRELQEFVAGFFTLHTSFHGAEILVLYVVYMLVAPLALLACAAGRGWLVLLVSAVIYFFSQRFPETVWLPVATYPFPAAWQPLFFGGLVIGYHRAWIAERVQRLPARTALGVAILVVASVFLIIHITDYRFWPRLPDLLGEREARMAWPRLSLVALCLVTFYLLVSWFWQPLRFLLGWLVIPLGQASLWSLTMHFVVIVLLLNLPGFALNGTILSGTLWHIFAILLIWASVKVRQLVLTRRSQPTT